MKNFENSITKKEEEIDFLENKVKVSMVSKEEFLKIMKDEEPSWSDDEILQAKGFNFNKDGQVVVLMRTDIFPEKYLPYLEIHEKWEAYIARKDGYNLFQKSVREYKNDKEISSFDDKTRKEFYGELSIYNYEFRHEYAIYKEYQKALQDGKLEEYHCWILELRKSELETASEQTKTLIQNDTAIRVSIYHKLLDNKKHYFTRN